MGLDKRYSAAMKALHAFIFMLIFSCILLAVVNPEKTLQLYPYPGAAVHLFADSAVPGGTSVTTWMDRGNSVYECNIGYGVQYPFCGLVIKYKNPEAESFDWVDYFEFSDAKSLDLASYDGISIAMDYSGPSNSLNFYLRNARDLPKDQGEYDQVPYIHADFATAEKGTFISFSNMQVAKWWIDRYDPPQNLRVPNFEHVFEMGIDLPALPAEGLHKFKLERITATKSYFPRKLLFPAIATLAGLHLLIFFVQRLLKYHSYRYKEENQTLRTTMTIDPLTQCLNRFGLEAAIKKLFPVSGNSGVYVIVMDLDHFKKINDTLGHTVGDEVLRQASTALSRELRTDDIFGRWGGEEFVIISNIKPDYLESFIARMMRSLEKVSIEATPDSSKVTMSVGITLAQPGESFNDVFERADKAMYQVKQSGRNNWKLV